MVALPRPAAIAVAMVLVVAGVGLSAGSAEAAAKATRVSGWAGSTVQATQGQVVRVRVAVRPARRSAKRAVVLQRRTSGAAWTNVTSTRTDTRGVASLRLPTARAFDGWIRLRVPGTHKARAVVTRARHLVVARRGRPADHGPRARGGPTGERGPGERSHLWQSAVQRHHGAPPRRPALRGGARTRPRHGPEGLLLPRLPGRPHLRRPRARRRLRATPAPRTSPPDTPPLPRWWTGGCTAPATARTSWRRTPSTSVSGSPRSRAAPTPLTGCRTSVAAPVLNPALTTSN